MWISNKNDWNPSITILERFLIEKIIQRCDFEEVLSNQHKTSNGFTQIQELLNLCILSQSRGKSIRAVKVLFEEVRYKNFNQNIVNDYIILKYFKDIKDFIISYDTSKLTNKDNQPELGELNKLIHKLTVFSVQLEKGYFESLRREFFILDLNLDKNFQRTADQISLLIDLLIPYLVFKGYALSSLSKVLKSWIEKKYSIGVKRIFAFFNFHNRTYDFLISVDSKLEGDIVNFLELIKDETDAEIEFGLVKELVKKYETLAEKFDENQKVLIYSTTNNLDPHIHFRTLYDKLLKRIVLQRERQSLEILNSFFNCCWWRISKKGKYFHQVELVNDPINVIYRGKTLRETLIKSSEDFRYLFDDDSNINSVKNSQLKSSIFFYNLALGSKSIENSLSLLWTSIESLLPYRVDSSDIVCVQSFVSKSLCLGSISRDVIGLGNRINKHKNRKGNPIDKLLQNSKLENGYKNMNTSWFEWITNLSDKDEKFKLLKSESELLAYEYSRIAQPLAMGKLEFLSKRIEVSRQSMSFQLQRIYLHRNQIVHSGNLINEYTNLWMHLEWYVGKLLAYSVIQLEFLNTKDNLRDVFTEIEADYEYVTSYLKLNKDVPISKLSSRIKKILLNYHWQSF